MTLANAQPVRFAFLVGSDKATAIKWAEGQSWKRLGIWRYTNLDCEDVRIVDAISEFRSFGGETKIYRAHGFDQRQDHEKWSKIVDDKLAKWGNRMEVAETVDER